NIIENIKSFDVEKLDKDQQNIYYEIVAEDELSNAKDDEKFDYIQNQWSSMNGVHQDLISFFTEYILRTEADIADLITLLNDTPRYMNEVLDYTRKQADEGLMHIDYDRVIEDMQNVINTQDNSAILNELYDEIEQLNLGLYKTADYKNQVKIAFNIAFIPSFENAISVLNELKPKNKELTGLSNMPNGQEYYTYMVQEATGSYEDIETIRSNLEAELLTIIVTAQDLMSKNENVFEEADAVKTQFNTPEEIMQFLLDNYKKDCVEISPIQYEINPLSDEQSNDGVVAYFVMPALDSTTKRQIRFNRRDYGDDMSSLDTYTTFAHEGIPGHMFMAQYGLDNYKYNIQHLYGGLGFTEGYATYSQFKAMEYLDVDQQYIDAYKYNEILTYYYVCLMDISIHYDGLSYDEFVEMYSDMFGTDLKALYNQLADSPASFLSYYYGYLQIENMRTEAEYVLGSKFNEKEFTDVILQSGPVNFDIIYRNVCDYILENK
ncbi:MAG: DUF885 family protein, partial [Holdemanella sp.]|nr:DUF885 family protein [Holdemanella sp.]